MITAIILCGDDAVGVINSEMSAEHHRQLTEIRKLARSVATQAPLMRRHFEVMYHISDGLDPHQIAAKLETSVEIVRKHIDLIVSRLTNAKSRIQSAHDFSTGHTSKQTRTATYLRVSRDDQTTENQRFVLARMAKHRGWVIVQTYEDQARLPRLIHCSQSISVSAWH